MLWSRAMATKLRTAPESRREPSPSEERERLIKLRLASALHSEVCGWNCPGHGILQPFHDAKWASAAEVAYRVVLEEQAKLADS